MIFSVQQPSFDKTTGKDLPMLSRSGANMTTVYFNKLKTRNADDPAIA